MRKRPSNLQARARRLSLLMAFGIVAAMPTMSQAQDRRAVSEPRLPETVCATLRPSDNASIQDRLDACAGRAVRLAGGRFETGPLTLPAGSVLVIDGDAVLAASVDAPVYDRGEGRCGKIDKRGGGCRAFITVTGGEDGGIVGDGVIDGQGGVPIAGTAESWWALARRAQKEGGNQNAPRLIQIDDARNFILYRIRLTNAANFHVVAQRARGFTAWGVVIDTPADARNTDGIDPAASEDVTITRSFIRTGDDNVAIKAGKTGATRHVSITDNHFYWGHGMSIGSEVNSGVSDVVVSGLTLDGTTSGLRIKSDPSRGGIVERVTYRDVCLRGNRYPIDIDTRYDKKASGTLIPLYRAITLKNILGEDGKLVIRGYDDDRALDVTLDGVRFSRKAKWDVSAARLTVGAGGVLPVPEGVEGLASAATQVGENGCTDRWAVFPERR